MAAGRNGLSAQALVLSPDHAPMPMNTSEPRPAAIRPGRRTSGSVAPPSPAASIRITAPMTGEPNTVEIAAKLPAAAMTDELDPAHPAWSGGRRARRAPSRGRSAAPPARARGRGRASRGRRQDARQLDRLCRPAPGVQPVGRDMPAVPGSRAIARAVSGPRGRAMAAATTRRTESKPRSPGEVVVDAVAGDVDELEERTHAASETTTPRIAAKTRMTRYCRLRISATGIDRRAAGGASRLWTWPPASPAGPPRPPTDRLR